jgi:hypothetical protein
MRSYPSWIAGLRYRSADGLDRGRYCAKHLQPGATLDLVPEPNNPHSQEGYAVAIKHRGRHLGYVPARHDWVGRALSERTTLGCVVVRMDIEGWFFRSARAVGLRIDVLNGGSQRLKVEPRTIDPTADAVRRNREQRAREACLDGLRVLAWISTARDCPNGAGVSSAI